MHTTLETDKFSETEYVDVYRILRQDGNHDTFEPITDAGPYRIVGHRPFLVTR